MAAVAVGGRRFRHGERPLAVRTDHHMQAGGMHSAMHFIAEHSPRRVARAHELVAGPVIALQFMVTVPPLASAP